MRSLGFALLLGLGGILVAAIYTFVIGLAGSPGAMLSAAAAKRSPEGITPSWGFFLTLVGQLYASLVFVALVIQFVEAHLTGITGFGRWAVWIVAFFIAVAPAGIALKDAARVQRRNVQHYAMTLTVPLTVIGFFVFRFFPAVMSSLEIKSGNSYNHAVTTNEAIPAQESHAFRATINGIEALQSQTHCVIITVEAEGVLIIFRKQQVQGHSLPELSYSELTRKLVHTDVTFLQSLKSVVENLAMLDELILL